MRSIVRIFVAAAALLLAGAVLVSCGGEDVKDGKMPPVNSDLSADSAPFAIYCFKAGKADAFAITTENSAVIIDTGEKGFGQTVLDYLESAGKKSVDCMIITHFDKDHVGGAAKIINSINVSRVLQSNFPKDSKEFDKYTKALEKSGISAETVKDGFEFELDGVTYTVDPPARDIYNADTSNNSSLIVKIKYGERTFLFTGDAEEERIAEYLKGGDADCDVLKVPHHGVWNLKTDALVSASPPRYALITSSDGEPEDEKTVALLESKGAEVFFTRKDAVTVVSDGESIYAYYGN